MAFTPNLLWERHVALQSHPGAVGLNWFSRAEPRWSKGLKAHWKAIEYRIP
jgi:hypothetical protein